MDSESIQMQWDCENETLTEPYQALITNNENFCVQIFSPFSGKSMDSGFNEVNGNNPPSPTYDSLQALRPNYDGFNHHLQNTSPYPDQIYSSPSSASQHQQDWYNPQLNSTPVSVEPIFLEICEQPNDNFRFRYPTEMQGPHGTIKGNNSANNGRAAKSFPTVVLHNYYNSTSEVVIKCCLYQKEEEGEMNRVLHPHKLAMRPADIDSHDPHYVKVSKQNNFTAVFGGLGVIQTKKEQMAEVLVNKIKKEREYEGNVFLASNEIESIREQAKLQAKKKIEINQIALGFTALMKDSLSNEWIRITDTVYSTTINNEKSVNGKLSIARMSACKGEAQGGNEIFMFVTKVDKNTIQVRFFETEDPKDPNGRVLWESNAIFTPSDVHHQYGIALKTPPYINQQIVEDVTVFVQLYRKNSPTKGRSEAVPFTYKPNRFKRKQARPPPPIPTVVSSYELLGDDSPVSSLSSSLQQISGSRQLMNENFGNSSQRQEQEDDLEIINLILKITSEGYESPPTDISSIVRDLRRGEYEIDAAIPKKHKTFSSLDKLKINEKLFEVLVKSTNDDQYAFADLVEKGDIEDIQAFTLLIAKYKLTKILHSKNDFDQNVLHLSILNGYFSMLKVFLKLGVNANQTDASGQTPLHLAVIANSNECVEALILIKNLSLDTINDRGETPLSLAVLNNNLKIVKSLISAGANSKIKNTTNGFNCLHIAVNSNKPSYEMIIFLIETDKSMLFAQTNSGKSVFQMAIANRLPQDIINYLSTFHNASQHDLELDEICLKKLCKIFDSRDNWKCWATLMDIEEKIGDWEGLQSPSRALFAYLKTCKKSLDDVIGLLDLLNDSERANAMNVIDEMIARKFEN